MEEVHEECGIFGIYDHEEAINITYLGLYALQCQHRVYFAIKNSPPIVRIYFAIMRIF
ncbi:MAG: hypothetical protein ACYDB5_10610 [bacterium]